MARTEDEKSVLGTPTALVFAASLLLLVRVADLVMNFGHAAEPPRAIAWRTTAALENVPAKTKNANVKPVSELSEESQIELKKMLEACKDAKKTLLLQFYANWSDPCKKMESSSLSNAQVKEMVSQNFIPVRVTDKMKECGRNSRLVSELQKRYRIFAFPTLLVVGPDGEPVSTLVGNCSSLTTYRFLSRTVYALNAANEVRQRTARSMQESIYDINRGPDEQS